MRVEQVLENKKLNFIPTDTNWYKTDTTVKYDNDHLFEQLSDLVNAKFRAWYCKMFYAIDKTRVLELASEARADGKDKRKLFSSLLKKEASKR